METKIPYNKETLKDILTAYLTEYMATKNGDPIDKAKAAKIADDIIIDYEFNVE